MIRLERGAWSMVKLLREATNEYAPPPSIGSSLIADFGETHGDSARQELSFGATSRSRRKQG